MTIYGVLIKVIMHKMFGEGTMSAIYFEIDVKKKEDFWEGNGLSSSSTKNSSPTLNGEKALNRVFSTIPKLRHFSFYKPFDFFLSWCELEYFFICFQVNTLSAQKTEIGL